MKGKQKQTETKDLGTHDCVEFHFFLLPKIHLYIDGSVQKTNLTECRRHWRLTGSIFAALWDTRAPESANPFCRNESRCASGFLKITCYFWRSWKTNIYSSRRVDIHSTPLLAVLNENLFFEVVSFRTELTYFQHQFDFNMS